MATFGSVVKDRFTRMTIDQLPEKLVVPVELHHQADDRRRNRFDGTLDKAKTVTVKAYFPNGTIPKSQYTLGPDSLIKVDDSTDGTYRTWTLEADEESGKVTLIVIGPKAYESKLESVTIKF